MNSKLCFGKWCFKVRRGPRGDDFIYNYLLLFFVKIILSFS